MANATCSVDGCGRRATTRGWCATHYERWRKNGYLGTAAIEPRNWTPVECSIDQCTNPAQAKGFCAHHYGRFNRYGDPLGSPVKVTRLCKMDGCGRRHYSMGYCCPHYQRWKQGGDPGSLEIRKLIRPSTCALDGCNEKHYCRGYCKRHYERFKRKGSPGPAELPPITVRGKFTECIVDGCSRRPFGHGYCSTHHKRWKTSGDPGSAEIKSGGRGQCSVDGCERTHSAKGYCDTHYAQNKRGMPLSPIAPRQHALERNEEGHKRCRACGQWLPTAEFATVLKNPDGLTVDCKTCRRHEFAAKRYGLTVDQYRALFEASGGKCAICNGINESGKALHVDHDHACCPGASSCGKCVRGLLCGRCNSGVGMFRDDPDLMLLAIGYLQKSAIT